NAGPPDATVLWSFLGTMGVLYLVVFAMAILVSIAFMFMYPLIVDCGLGGVAAVKTSARAAFANLAGLTALVLLNAVLGLAGALCCYVGAFLVMPIAFGAVFAAYRQVFPVAEAYAAAD